MATLVERINNLSSYIANYIRDWVLPRLVPPGGATGQVLGKASAADNDLTWLTAGGVASIPVGSLSSSDIAKKSFLAIMQADDGAVNFMQEALWQKNISVWYALGLGTATDNIAFPTAHAGNPTIRYVGGSNLFTTARRIGYVSTASANSFASIRNTNSTLTTGQGGGKRGFFCSFKFGISDPVPVSGAAMFVGLYINSSVNSSFETLNTNRTIGIGCNPDDTTLSVVAKGASGAAHVINLGSNFPANTANEDWYTLFLFSPSTVIDQIFYRVVRENTGHVATGQLTPEVYPALNDVLCPVAARFNKSVALAVGIDVGCMYTQFDN